MSRSYGRMSDPLCSANTRSCACASRPAPGFFPIRVMPIWVSGQMRNRRLLLICVVPAPNTSNGTGRNRTLTSVAVTGIVLPARITIGTPAHRHAHTFGRRPHDNSATNLQWLAWLTAGEGLHNNHHAAPTSAKLSFVRGEVDPAWPAIAGLRRLRLASVRHVGLRPAHRPIPVDAAA